MPIKHIAIFGGGVAGWMVASVLARVLDRDSYAIQLVDEGGGDVGLGPSTPVLTALPSARLFHAQFGFAEDDIINATRGCFSLGTAISGWTASGAASFQPFGDTGAAIGHVGFHHLAWRHRREGFKVNLADYSLAALCAQADRFARPPKDCMTVLSSLDYGITVPAKAYADLFKADALAKGVSVLFGEVRDVALGSEDQIKKLRLACGEQMSADLFIDCTGAAAKIIGKLPGSTFESWKKWLPCDSVLNMAAPAASAPHPYFHLAAHSLGWSRFVTVAGDAHQSSIYNASCSNESHDNAGVFAPGCRSAVWEGNCIAIGASAAVIEPISSLPLHLLQSSIQRLVALFPSDANGGVERREFNRQSGEQLECARDFAILPYKINGRHGEKFWDACRAMDVPDKLARKIELYEATGRIALYDGEIFEDADWIALLDAQDITPRRYDPAANGIPIDVICKHFERVRQIMIAEVANIPFHRDYLASLGR
jgi:tryptophan 7-halogenase